MASQFGYITKRRIYVLYGQGGYLTSIGMANLATRLEKLFPESLITRHSWNDTTRIEADIRGGDPRTPKALIGFSLGANSIPFMAARLQKYPIALAVLYDPSVSGVIVDIMPNIKRLLLYHNTGSGSLGHLILHGLQVERTDVTQWHLGVCFNESLHQQTIAAVARIAP